MPIEIVVYPLTMVMFHSYVSLPESNWGIPYFHSNPMFILALYPIVSLRNSY